MSLAWWLLLAPAVALIAGVDGLRRQRNRVDWVFLVRAPASASWAGLASWSQLPRWMARVAEVEPPSRAAEGGLRIPATSVDGRAATVRVEQWSAGQRVALGLDPLLGPVRRWRFDVQPESDERSLLLVRVDLHARLRLGPGAWRRTQGERFGAARADVLALRAAIEEDVGCATTESSGAGSIR